MTTGEEDTKPGLNVGIARARVSSISQLDQLSVLVGILRAVGGVEIPEEAEPKVKEEIKSYGDSMIDHGRMSSVTDIEGLRSERAHLLAQVEDLRARDREIKLAISKYERGHCEWGDVRCVLVGEK